MCTEGEEKRGEGKKERNGGKNEANSVKFCSEIAIYKFCSFLSFQIFTHQILSVNVCILAVAMAVMMMIMMIMMLSVEWGFSYQNILT